MQKPSFCSFLQFSVSQYWKFISLNLSNNSSTNVPRELKFLPETYAVCKDRSIFTRTYRVFTVKINYKIAKYDTPVLLRTYKFRLLVSWALRFLFGNFRGWPVMGILKVSENRTFGTPWKILNRCPKFWLSIRQKLRGSGVWRRFIDDFYRSRSAVRVRFRGAMREYGFNVCTHIS